MPRTNSVPRHHRTDIAQDNPEDEHQDQYVEDDLATDRSLHIQLQLDSASPSISDHSQPSLSTPSSTFSDNDTNVLRSHLKSATLSADIRTVGPSGFGKSGSQLDMTDETLRESLQIERTRTTALEEEKALLAKNLFLLRANLSYSGARKIAEREANLAELRKQNAEMVNKMKNLRHDFSVGEDKIVQQEAKIAAMQREKSDLADNLKLVRSDFRQLEDIVQSERLNQGNELAYLEEQLVAFNQLIASLEVDKNQLKQIIDERRFEGEDSDCITLDEASSSVDATNQSRINQVEEENQSLKSKLIDTLDKLVEAQNRLEKFATAQTLAAGFFMPHEGQQGTKRPGSFHTEPAAKKAKDLKPPNSEHLQPSKMGSVDHYLCLVPQQSASGTEENYKYVGTEEALNSYVIEKVHSLIVTFAKKAASEGFSAWQSAAVLYLSCAFCRYISRKESEWYQGDRACARCTKNHRPCIVVHRIGEEEVAVLLPLTVDRRHGLKPSDTGYWIRV